MRMDWLTFCETVANQIVLHHSQEVPVKRQIDDEEQALLSAIPSS